MDEDYDVICEKMKETNWQYLDGFAIWLAEKGLIKKTVGKHISNMDFYINSYLVYYEVQPVDRGCYEIDGFLGDWFIRKAMWSSAATIKENAASMKKFYLFMLEKGHIQKVDYDTLLQSIKEDMEDWLENMEEYENGTYMYTF